MYRKFDWLFLSSITLFLITATITNVNVIKTSNFKTKIVVKNSLYQDNRTIRVSLALRLAVNETTCLKLFDTTTAP